MGISRHGAPAAPVVTLEGDRIASIGEAGRGGSPWGPALRPHGTRTSPPPPPLVAGTALTMVTTMQRTDTATATTTTAVTTMATTAAAGTRMGRAIGIVGTRTTATTTTTTTGGRMMSEGVAGTLRRVTATDGNATGTVAVAVAAAAVAMHQAGAEGARRMWSTMPVFWTVEAEGAPLDRLRAS
jgi:hypothetical protein